MIIVKDSHLVGSKKAFLFADDYLLVSPAIYQLISKAEDGELERLLGMIPVSILPFPLVPEVPRLDMVSSPAYGVPV